MVWVLHAYLFGSFLHTGMMQLQKKRIKLCKIQIADRFSFAEYCFLSLFVIPRMMVLTVNTKLFQCIVALKPFRSKFFLLYLFNVLPGGKKKHLGFLICILLWAVWYRKECDLSSKTLFLLYRVKPLEYNFSAILSAFRLNLQGFFSHFLRPFFPEETNGWLKWFVPWAVVKQTFYKQQIIVQI